MKKENWKYIVGFEGKYSVSDWGRVRSNEREFWNGKELRYIRQKILKATKQKNGYEKVTLYDGHGKKKCCYVHRLVLIAFKPNPYGYSDVNHINEDKTDNRLDNLDWCDRKTNINYGTHNLRISQSMRNSKMAEIMLGNQNGNKKVICDGNTFDSCRLAAEFYGVNYITFNQWLRGINTMPAEFKNMNLRYA